MDWETPADAWYVWLGVSIISLAMAGFVLGLPTGPPPDADQAANTIERTSGSTYQAASTVQHDADEIKVDGKTIELRNEHGTDRSSIRYGEVVAVNGEDRLERIVYGEDFEDEFEDELEDQETDAAAAFMEHVATAAENNSGEWLTASDELTVRQVGVEPDEMADIYVEISSHSSEEFRVDGDMGNTEDSIPEGVSITTEEYERVGPSTEVDYTFDGRLVPEAGSSSTATTSNVVSTDLRLNLNSHDNVWGWDTWAGYYPLTVTAEYDDYTCEGTIFSGDEQVNVCSQDTEADELAGELDWIEMNDETEEYHVTLVVV